MDFLLKSTRCLQQIANKSPSLISQECNKSIWTCSALTQNDSYRCSKNILEFEHAEKAKFSPTRSRDNTSGRMVSFSQNISVTNNNSRQLKFSSGMRDNHVSVYDGTNAISLSSVMPTSNIAIPPKSTNNLDRPSPLNMPEGHMGQKHKYVSGEMKDQHVKSYSMKTSKGSLDGWCGHIPNMVNKFLQTNKTSRFPVHTRSICFSLCRLPLDPNRFDQLRYIHCSHSLHSSNLSKQREKLKQAVKEYGSTVIIFHVAISLASLGFFYLLVSSGIDMTGIIDYFDIKSLKSVPTTDVASIEDNENETTTVNKTAVVAGVSTFVVAYAVHKVFAPVRIAVTLSSTPFIVRYLRSRGIIKKV